MGTPNSGGSSRGKASAGHVIGLLLIRLFIGAVFAISTYSMLPLPSNTEQSVPPAVRQPVPAHTAAGTQLPEGVPPPPGMPPGMANTATPPATGVAPAPGTPPTTPTVPLTASPQPKDEGFFGAVRDYTAPDGLFVKDAWLPFYAEFLSKFVNPNYKLFGWLVMIGLGLVGLLLIVGYWTRTAAAIGMVMNIAFLLAFMHGQTENLDFFATFALTTNIAFIIMQLTLILGNTKRVPGLDMLFSKR